MKEVTEEDHKRFVSNKKEIIQIDGNKKYKIRIGEKRITNELQPKIFNSEVTTVWSFPNRGNWATHRGDFRGNFAPEIPRNLITRYSKIGETVLDQMCGSGTTLVECKLLVRNGIGVDINHEYVMLTKDRLSFDYNSQGSSFNWQKTFVGDARNLNLIGDASIDLIVTHPPYLNIISYSHGEVDGDLSKIGDVSEYLEEMKVVASECFRVLRPNRYCCILVGDTRRYGYYVPIAFEVMQVFLRAGFLLKEDIIKHQWQCKSTPYWFEKSIKYNFLLIMHEHIFVFRKPRRNEKWGKFS
nr:DNA methyltransferase [Candidatus Freyarchaeota archaeon]